MKLYFLAALLVLGLCGIGQVNGDKKSSSVTWGARLYGDMHVERVLIRKEYKFLRKVQKEYTFKQTYPRKITQIVITDLEKNGKGGKAYLRGGGPGATFANIVFKSRRNNGLNFSVDIYAINM